MKQERQKEKQAEEAKREAEEREKNRFLNLSDREKVSLPTKSTQETIHVAEFSDSIDSDEVAHDEPPHLDLHCLPCIL